MQQITLSLPQDMIRRLPAGEVEQEIRRYLAIKFYQQEDITLGKAAELAGMSRMDFEYVLAHNRIPISLLDYEDIRADLARMNPLVKPVQAPEGFPHDCCC